MKAALERRSLAIGCSGRSSRSRCCSPSNSIFNPGFLAARMRDGHLFGGLIDILNRAAPLVLVALGMTLVIATRGIDISVGAVVAIAGAVAAPMIGGDLVVKDGVPTQAAASPWPGDRRRARASALLAACGTACWSPCVGMQPIIATLILMVAGRGVAQLLTGGQIIPIDSRRSSSSAAATCSACRSRVWIAAAVCGAAAPADEAHGARPVHPGDRHQSGGDAAGRPAAQRLITVCVYVFCGFARRRGGPPHQLERARAPTATTPACCSNSTRSSP